MVREKSETIEQLVKHETLCQSRRNIVKYIAEQQESNASGLLIMKREIWRDIVDNKLGSKWSKHSGITEF